MHLARVPSQQVVRLMEARGIQGWRVKWYVLLLAHNLERGIDFLSAVEVGWIFKKVLRKFKMHTKKYTYPKDAVF